jgi:tagaturonate reductase
MPKPLNRKSAGIASNRPVKVLQFGEGNFLRAFADWIIDLLNERTNFNGDVQIIQPLSKGTGEMINEQDGLYHVVLNGILNGKPTTVIRLIQCVRGVINPYEDFKGYLRTAENPDLQIIISNTTEAGIAFHPDDTNPEKLPSSFPGKLTVLLYHRFKFFSGAPGKALTLIPCELIDRNGQKLRDAIIQYIRLWDLPDAFLNWIQHHTSFCNTLVDRIVPGFPKETITQIQDSSLGDRRSGPGWPAYACGGRQPGRTLRQGPDSLPHTKGQDSQRRSYFACAGCLPARTSDSPRSSRRPVCRNIPERGH